MRGCISSLLLVYEVCFLLLAGVPSILAAACEHEVVDHSVDCFGFANTHGKLSLLGVQLVDQQSDPIQLRGISAHGIQWFPDCVTKSALIHLVTTWGINLFRVPVYLEVSESGYLSDPTYFDNYVDQIVQWCEELGIYVLIDFHVLSKGDPNEYLDSKGASTGVAIDFWTKYANLYKNTSHVLYEIANEPNNIDWTSVLAYHNAVISAIRLIDPETIIVAGTTTWSQDIHLAAANPVNQPYNVMYTFHFYAASHGSLYDRVASHINTIPIFVSEWGISAADGNGGYDTAVAQQYLDLFADISSTILSWTMWSWSDKDETSAILTNSVCGSSQWTNTRCPSKFVENYFKSEDYSLMIACNSSGYVPYSENDTASFVEEYEWIFWTIGALSLLGICVLLFKCCNNNEGEANSFLPVSKTNTSAEKDFEYESNPYNNATKKYECSPQPIHRAQIQKKAPVSGSSSSEKALSSKSPSRTNASKQTTSSNRPGQRRKKLTASAASSRNNAQKRRGHQDNL